MSGSRRCASGHRSTRSTAGSAPGWCRSAGGRCRSSTPARSTSTSPAGAASVMFDVSHLGTVRVEGDDAFDVLQRTLHERPGEDRAGSGPVHAPARRRRRVGARRHHRVVAPGERGHGPAGVRRDAERLQHRPRARRDRRRRDHQRPGRDRRPGTGRSEHCRRRSGRRRPRSVDSGSPTARGRATPCVVAGTGYTGEDGIEIAVPADAAESLWDAIDDAGASRPGSVPATRCGSKPRCRCTVTSSDPASRRCRPGWAGWSRGTRVTSRDATPSSPNASAASTAGWSASPRRAAARRGPAARSSSTARPSARSRRATTRRSSSTASRSGSCRPTCRSATTSRSTSAASRLPGQVVATPFVGR